MLVSRPDISASHLAAIAAATLVAGALTLPLSGVAQDRQGAEVEAPAAASATPSPRAAAPEPEPLEAPAARPSEATAVVERGPVYASVGEPSVGWPEDGHETQFTFVQISDTHVGREGDALAFAAAVRHINALRPRPSFVMITGDLTDGFLVDEVASFKAIASRLEVPVHVVPGNHDEGFSPSSRAIKYYNHHFPEHQTPYRVDQGGVSFIGLDSQLFNARRRSAEAAAHARTQWEALEGLLAEARAEGQRLVLFHHIPFFPSWQPTGPLRPQWKARHREAYRELLARFDVEAELTGHFHRDEFYVEGETLLLNAPPISQKFGRRSSYRIFRVTDAGLTFRQIYYLSPEGRRGRHYQLDLHHLTAAAQSRWIDSLGEDDLRLLWRRRQAYDVDADVWFTQMDKVSWRAYLKAPLGEPAGEAPVARR